MGSLRRCFVLCRRCRAAGNVARADDHRERPLVSAGFILQRLDVADDDRDLLARHDVGDGLREDVRALLIEQAGNLAVRLRLRVSGLRFFAAHDLAVNGAIADLHRHIVNGCGLRQRERIDRFDLIGEWIGKLLRHGHPREKAADLGSHVRVLERKGDDAALHAGLERAAPRKVDGPGFLDGNLVGPFLQNEELRGLLRLQGIELPGDARARRGEPGVALFFRDPQGCHRASPERRDERETGEAIDAHHFPP